MYYEFNSLTLNKAEIKINQNLSSLVDIIDVSIQDFMVHDDNTRVLGYKC